MVSSTMVEESSLKRQEGMEVRLLSVLSFFPGRVAADYITAWQGWVMAPHLAFSSMVKVGPSFSSQDMKRLNSS